MLVCFGGKLWLSSPKNRKCCCTMHMKHVVKNKSTHFLPIHDNMYTLIQEVIWPTEHNATSMKILQASTCSLCCVVTFCGCSFSAISSHVTRCFITSLNVFLNLQLFSLNMTSALSKLWRSRPNWRGENNSKALSRRRFGTFVECTVNFIWSDVVISVSWLAVLYREAL